MYKLVPIAQIKPYPGNPRKNDEAVKAVASSIREFGFQAPIIVDAQGVIIAGHTRYKAATSLGLKEVPVIYADLDEAKARAYRLADNKSTQLAEWDFDKLADELQWLMDAQYDIAKTQFDWREVSRILDSAHALKDADEFDPRPPAKARTGVGNMYILGGRHRLFCGDCTIPEDMERLMGGARCDMILTDPPWNVDYGGTDHPSWKSRKILNDKMTQEQFGQFLGNAFTTVRTHTKDGAMVYVFMSAQEWGTLMGQMAGAGFHWSSTIIWAKDRLVLSRKDYHTQYEPMYYGWASGAPRVHPLVDREQSDVWNFPKPSKSDLHPTMKPVDLLCRAIQNSSNRDDLVVDMFGGSGSTLIAAEQTGRTCYMMELDPGNCDVIAKRYIEFTGKGVTLDGVECGGFGANKEVQED